jgi:flagellar assembly protein FliH
LSSVILGHESVLRRWDLLPLGRPINGNGRERGDSPLAELPAGPVEAPLSPLEESAQVVASAEVHAQRILQQAREEAARLLADAREEGLQLGREAALKEVATAQERLADLTNGVEGAYLSFCNQQVPQLADLAIFAAERLICDQLSLVPERVVGIVKQALDHLAGSQQIVIRVNPDDLPLLEQCLDLRTDRETGRIMLQEDVELERGGCRMISEQGEVDATLSGRVRRLREELTGGARD